MRTLFSIIVGITLLLALAFALTGTAEAGASLITPPLSVRAGTLDQELVVCRVVNINKDDRDLIIEVHDVTGAVSTTGTVTLAPGGIASLPSAGIGAFYCTFNSPSGSPGEDKDFRAAIARTTFFGISDLNGYPAQ